MSPQISFIVPVYNTQQYLNRCFSSIVQQKYEDWEVIVVNDGSTDESLEILQKWALRDRRIKVVTQKNAGLSVARNTGMKYAKSEWIGFIDSDDYIEPNTLSSVVKNSGTPFEKQISRRIIFYPKSCQKRACYRLE